MVMRVDLIELSSYCIKGEGWKHAAKLITQTALVAPKLAISKTKLIINEMKQRH